MQPAADNGLNTQKGEVLPRTTALTCGLDRVSRYGDDRSVPLFNEPPIKGATDVLQAGASGSPWSLGRQRPWLRRLAPTPASAAAFVLTPGELECFFEPGDVPGVDVFFPGRCSQVVTPSGNTLIVGRGELPAGYTLEQDLRGFRPVLRRHRPHRGDEKWPSHGYLPLPRLRRRPASAACGRSPSMATASAHSLR